MDTIKLYYDDGMDLINAVEKISEYLEKNHNLTIEFLDGGDGYEEVIIKQK